MMHIFLYTYSFDPINGSFDLIKGRFDLINQIVGKEGEV
jgi:hypothetical protein